MEYYCTQLQRELAEINRNNYIIIACYVDTRVGNEIGTKIEPVMKKNGK
jgi:hypothetical protein